MMNTSPAPSTERARHIKGCGSAAFWRAVVLDRLVCVQTRRGTAALQLRLCSDPLRPPTSHTRPTHLFTPMRTGLASLVSLCLAAACLADQWTAAEANARLSLSVQGDLHARGQTGLETIIDFNQLLGAHRVLATESLELTEAGTGTPVTLEMAQDADLLYASGNPILRLRWTCPALPAFAEKRWHLYIRAVPRGTESTWVPLEETFVPNDPRILMNTSFEAADPKRPNRPEFMTPGGRDVEGETTERVWTDESPHSGSKSLKISRTYKNGPPRNTNRPFWWAWPPAMPVTPGQSVRIRAWTKAPKLSTGALPLIVVRFCDKNRKRLPTAQLLIRGQRIPHDWAEVNQSVTAPAGAAWVIWSFSLHGEGTAYCDDVKVTTIPGGALPPLAVTAGTLEDRAAFAAAEDERPEGKVLACSEAAAPPVLDGHLDDSCWHAAGRASDFSPHAQVPGTRADTTVRVCADRDALYLGFDCAESAASALKANATTRDGRLWEDDSVELFLDTNSDLRTYYQVIVNSRGVIFDQDKGMPGLAGAKWDGPVTAAAHVEPDRWTAEVRIGFVGLRLAQSNGRTWGANFARSSFRGGRSLYVWSPVQSNFGEPQHFGRIVLPFDPSANVVSGRPLLGDTAFLGKGELPIEATNQRAVPVTVRAMAIAEEAGEDRILGTVTGTVPADATAVLQIPAQFADVGEARVRYELVEDDTSESLYMTSVTHAVPEALLVKPGTLVSYVGEDQLRGTWTLGLAEGMCETTRLVIHVLSTRGERPCATTEIPPKGRSGTYAVSTSGLPRGTYRVRARLVCDTKTLGEREHQIERVLGPFSPSPEK